MESQTKAITGHDQLAQMVLSVSPSSRWGILFFPGYRLSRRPNVETAITWLDGNWKNMKDSTQAPTC